MASTFAAPTESGSGGFDIFSELGATMGSEEDSPTSNETTPEPVAGAPEAAPPADPSAPTDPAAPPAEAKTDDPFPLSEDGANYLVPKAELANYTGMRQYVSDVQARFPTVADAQMGYQQSSDFRAMQQDFLYPDEGSFDRMLNFWAGGDAQDPGLRAQMQQSFTQLAQRIPDMLQQVNPQAFDQFAEGIFTSRIEAAYAKAAQTGNEEDKLKAQRLDWAKTGQYKTELPKHDPQAAARSVAEQQRADMERREGAMLDRDFKAFNSSVMDGVKWGSLNQEIDKVLAPIKGKYDAQELADIRELVQKDLLHKLQTDAEWSRTHSGERRALEAEYRRLWKSGQDPTSVMKPRVTGYINDLLVRARQHLPSIAAPRISKATARAVAGTKPAQAQNRTPRPPNSNAPASPGDGKSKFTGSIHEDPEWQKLWSA